LHVYRASFEARMLAPQDEEIVDGINNLFILKREPRSTLDVCPVPGAPRLER
jgi:hypothetical protein